MSFSVSSQKSFSARSISGTMTVSGRRPTPVRFTGSNIYQQRAPSVYGGAGGHGTRISNSVFSFGTVSAGTMVVDNEKFTMQNLNDRLATYLDKVRSLESANRKLELHIREFYEKKTPSASRDYNHYLATITELRAQIVKRFLENQSNILQIENSQLAAEDFKIKYETELSMRTAVEADLARFRGVRDGLTLDISDLEVQIEGLKEELLFLQKNHQEDLQEMRITQTGQVNVAVESSDSVDLIKTLDELREHYEAVVSKNQQELQKWYQDKTEKAIFVRTEEVKTSHAELSELRRTLQSLEISRQSISTGIQCLHQNTEEVNVRYGAQIAQYQTMINTFELELQHLKLSIEQQQSDYNALLDVKMRLELEIAEYRRLLEGELYQEKSVVVSKVENVQKKAMVISKVEEVVVEEYKPHIERRVKTIVEEIVDGKVVSSSVDTQVENIQ